MIFILMSLSHQGESSKPEDPLKHIMSTLMSELSVCTRMTDTDISARSILKELSKEIRECTDKFQRRRKQSTRMKEISP